MKTKKMTLINLAFTILQGLVVKGKKLHMFLLFFPESKNIRKNVTDELKQIDLK